MDKASRDARQLLGMQDDDNRLMQLHKPMYGLCDAPRAWYMEAVDRILSIPNVVRRPLDACLFVVYDTNEAAQLRLTAETSAQQHTPGELVALFGIHVDDLLGCGDINNKVCKEVKEKLHQLFSFRMWEETKNLQNCGCDILQEENNITLQQTAYLHIQKPITITPQRKAQQHEPLNHKETTQLRALVVTTNSIPSQTETHHYHTTTQSPTTRATQPQKNNATQSTGWVTTVAKHSISTTLTVRCITASREG